MPQYAFVEVGFFARSQIQKIAKQVKRFFVFDGTESAWPSDIRCELVATLQGGSNKREDILAQLTATQIVYYFKERYSNPTDWISVNDMVGGVVGCHTYYLLESSSIQPYILHYINSLGQQGWELAGSPASSGSFEVKFDIQLYGPGISPIEFKGGSQQITVGRSKNNPAGLIYTLKKQL